MTRKATNVDAAVTAIEAIGKDIILIAGGDGKGQDFTDLIKNFRGRVKHLILLGRDGPLISAAADKEGYGDHESCPEHGRMRKAGSSNGRQRRYSSIVSGLCQLGYVR